MRSNTSGRSFVTVSRRVETDIYDVHDYDQNPETFTARYQQLITGKGEIYKN